MIEKPDQEEALTLTRRQWVRVAAALAIRTYTDPRLQDLATLFGQQIASWERHAEDADDYSMCVCGREAGHDLVDYQTEGENQ